jgi:hypothetical protein
MPRGRLLKRLQAVEGRERPRAPRPADQVLTELSLDAVRAIRDAYKAHGITGDKPPGPNPQLEAEVWAILWKDAPSPEVFARWDALLREPTPARR